MATQLSQRIFELKELGYSYNQIASELGCSKGTVCYHLGDGQKEKQRARHKLYMNTHPVHKKILRFCSRQYSPKNNEDNTLTTLERKLWHKIYRFSGRSVSMFSAQELLDKVGDDPRCYLTGRKIDLSETKSYHLDHIVPTSRGGDNSLENCGLACRIANLSKTEMTYEEYVSLCKEVVNNHANR